MRNTETLSNSEGYFLTDSRTHIHTPQKHTHIDSDTVHHHEQSLEFPGASQQLLKDEQEMEREREREMEREREGEQRDFFQE